MKRILITGTNSFIGNGFAKWTKKNKKNYFIEKISVRDETWKEKDFSNFDVILHVAGIAHKRETKNNVDLYYKVNRDLTFEIASKAKNDGVKQFVFISSMSVYGINRGVITKNTPLNPKTHYGKSKLQAEKLINSLSDNKFKVVIIRPPMIYGKGCKGNYPKLAKLAKVTPFFPDIDNQRSMIFIDNLSQYIATIIDYKESGIFLPQNNEFVKTSHMVKLIGEINGNNVRLIKIFNPFIRLINFGIVNKVFGDLVYEKSLSKYKNIDTKLVNLEQSIFMTED